MHLQPTFLYQGMSHLREYRIDRTTLPGKVACLCLAQVDPDAPIPAGEPEPSRFFAVHLDGAIWACNVLATDEAVLISGTDRPTERIAGLRLARTEILGEICCHGQLMTDQPLSNSAFYYRSGCGLTRSELADATGVSLDDIISLEEGAPSDEAVARNILLHLVALRHDALNAALVEQGHEALFGDAAPEVDEILKTASQPERVKSDDVPFIPDAAMSAVAIYGGGGQQVPRSLLSSLGVRVENAIIAEVPDDRMAPVYRKGARVLVDTGIKGQVPETSSSAEPLLLRVDGAPVIAFASFYRKTASLSFTSPGIWPESRPISEVFVIGRVMLQMPG